MSEDIRWLQRFQNFKQAYLFFKEASDIPRPSAIEEAGLIQTFEFTFELGRKTLKDLLESEGFSPKSPKETIKMALQAGHIQDGHTWIDALEKRNLMAHTYDENKAATAIQLIRNHYATMLQSLFLYLSQKSS